MFDGITREANRAGKELRKQQREEPVPALKKASVLVADDAPLCETEESTPTIQRTSENPETYLTGIFWSKEKAKATLDMQPWGPVTHHLPKGMKRIRLSTNQKQPDYRP
ncbi:hypothetical protein llap_11653 [Limosa lapponica baueri]|uniref:Uncharacterized protein n=1 Tax=Limosa lapponica baueri TaxID=1758121 RepID=A0A2I0TWF5_LIMLA|nr:hypothetical protein llap_11653 [Limosa lapponica baueri]